MFFKEQEGRFVAKYEKLKRNLPDEDHIIFMDGVHLAHTVRFTRGWITGFVPIDGHLTIPACIAGASTQPSTLQGSVVGQARRNNESECLLKK
jgi:hypothetical protein